VLDDWANFRATDFSPAAYERVWGSWNPSEINLGTYLRRLARTLG
jgi:hypothetical protein